MSRNDRSTGKCVFQNVYSYYPPLIRFGGYREYLEEMAAIHDDVPFVVLECGYSVSPQAEQDCAAEANCGQSAVPKPCTLCFGTNSEAEQARGLACQYEHATSRPGLVAGFFVFEYFDEWWKGSERSQWVHDEDRAEEWFGIKAVTGDADACEVTNRAAFETVRRMFEQSPTVRFRRGDADADGKVNITDAIRTLLYLFQAGEVPECRDAADADDTGTLNITDAIYALEFLFRAGPPPPSPGSESCGADPTPDAFPPCEYEADCS